MTESLLVDTHAHLADAAFAGDLPAVLDRARAAGVGRVIVVSVSPAEARTCLELASRHRELLPAAGLYPGRQDPAECDALASLVRRERDRLAAVGEVGLDHWISRGPGEEQRRERQAEVFRRVIALALEVNLPLNVHSRSAGPESIRLLLECGARRVQLHAFDGRFSTAQAALEAGYYFSIPPSVVRSPQKRKLLGHLPLSCLLVESDSPVLGPDPAERNEPANVALAVGEIAAVKGVAEEAVREAVAANAKALYGDRVGDRRSAGS